MKAIRTSLAAATLAATALTSVATPAAAEHRNWRDHDRGTRVIYCTPRNNYCGQGGHRGGHVVRRHDNGNAAGAIALGIIGTAIIAGALSEANRPAPRPVYRHVEPQPVYPPAPSGGPRVITYEDAYQSYEPWTKGWYEWCDDRYRSFNPRTGTFRGYDGRDHFCVVK